jgi:hypothetical protein
MISFGVLAAVAVTFANIRTLNPTNPLVWYALEVGVIGAVVVGALASWWAIRRGWSWDADLWPAIYGGIAAVSLLTALSGTPYAPNGLQGDQAFRTEAVTRFADTWNTADFTYKDLPAFYAPAYFWVLGRISDIGGIEPWRMLKLGTTAAAILVPLVAFVLWRRQVPTRVAALIAGVALVVPNYYEPYSWLVMVAFVPWWMEAVEGTTRPGVRPWHPVTLGLVGSILFLTYYYFFFVGAIALLIGVVLRRTSGRWDTGQLRRLGAVFATMVVGTAVFWVPLIVSIARAEHPVSEANRWFATAPLPPLPFFEPTLTGLVTLIGLAFLILTARTDRLARGLLTLLVATVVWYLVGFPAAAIGAPLLTFRAEPLVPLILTAAGVLGLVRVARYAIGPAGSPSSLGGLPRSEVGVAAGLVGVLLILFAARTFMVSAVTDPLMKAAHDERLPDGTATVYSTLGADPDYVSVVSIADAIDSRYAGADHPVVLSTRSDVLAVEPYYGFVQWQVYYSHPAGEFPDRIEFLRQLAGSASPEAFARDSADNRFDSIDAFVLASIDGELVFNFRDDNFPRGAKAGTVAFDRSLFSSSAFELVDFGDIVVAVRR